MWGDFDAVEDHTTDSLVVHETKCLFARKNLIQNTLGVLDVRSSLPTKRVHVRRRFEL